jgi:hypothetical protein
MNLEPKWEMPIFSDAVKSFQEFLVSQRVYPELLWVFHEDVISSKQRILVKEPLPPENEELVESLYMRGCHRGLGVQFDVCCILGSRPCCYIWLPEDEYEAHYMIGNLKLTVPVDLLYARSVKSKLMWSIYRWLSEKSDWNKAVERIPHKQNLIGHPA